MSDEFFHFVTISIQIVTFALFIFGGGKYIGTITESLRSLLNKQKVFEVNFAEHLLKDETSFRLLDSTLNAIKIDIAVIKNSLDSKSHGR